METNMTEKYGPGFSIEYNRKKKRPKKATMPTMIGAVHRKCDANIPNKLLLAIKIPIENKYLIKYLRGNGL